MKDNYIYTTSQLAKQYDLTPKGLAFYEKHGLVSHLENKTINIAVSI